MRSFFNGNDGKQRQFAVMFFAVFVALAFWPLWPLRAPTWSWLIVACAFLAAGIFVPRALVPIYRVWMFVGHVLGWINSRLLMGLVFYLLVTPTALVLKLRGRDLLRTRAGRSYWVARAEPPSPQSMRNQF